MEEEKWGTESSRVRRERKGESYVYYVCVLFYFIFSHVCLVGSTYIYYYEYFPYLFTFIYFFIFLFFSNYSNGAFQFSWRNTSFSSTSIKFSPFSRWIRWNCFGFLLFSSIICFSFDLGFLRVSMACNTNASNSIMQNNVVTSPALNQASEYYVHPREGLNSVIVSLKHDGSRYLAWTRPMHRALGAKNKFQFLDGSIPVPALQDLNRLVWVRRNNLIHSWIVNSVSSQIAQSIIFI